MDALLVLNNKNVRNLRVMVHVAERKVKEKVISLLEEDKGDEAFDILVKRAEVRTYLPGETPPPRIPLLITLDEELLKSKPPAKLKTVNMLRTFQKWTSAHSKVDR